jgi:hypothetical protein
LIFRVARACVHAARRVDLLTLVRHAALRGHTLWLVEDHAGPGLDEETLWQSLGDSVGDTVRSELALLHDAVGRIRVHATTLGSVTVGVAPTPDNRAASGGGSCDFVVDVQVAIRLAAAPLGVLVEDVVSDAAFLRRAMPAAWRAWLRAREDEGALIFVHGGGKPNMEKFIRDFGGGSRPAPGGLGASAWRATHVFIFDRDATPPEVGKTQNAVRELLERRGDESRLWVLGRYEAEHYLPVELLDALKLQPDQREKADEARAKQTAFPEVKARRIKRAFVDLPEQTDEETYFASDHGGSKASDEAPAHVEPTHVELTRIAEWISAHL